MDLGSPRIPLRTPPRTLRSALWPALRWAQAAGGDQGPLLAALRGQARACAELGSPFTSRLLLTLAEELTPTGPLGPRLFGWEGDLTGSGASLPLRLAGALHALVLSGAAPALAAAYPPRGTAQRPGPTPPAPTAGDDLRSALRAAIRDHAAVIDRVLDGPPQTNEVGRSAALIAAAHWLHARHPLPLRLSELGASAGLNLRFDACALRAGATRLGPDDAALLLSPDWEGPAPAPAPVRVLDRRGVDLAPLDPSDPAQRLRLRAYVGPDQPDRLDAALALPPAPVDRDDAGPWLARRLTGRRPGSLHLVYHTVAWQYFPPATQAACLAALEEAGARATSEAPLARLAMESDGPNGSGRPPGAALTLTLWPGGGTIPLGRADFHGRWVRWAA